MTSRHSILDRLTLTLSCFLLLSWSLHVASFNSCSSQCQQSHTGNLLSLCLMDCKQDHSYAMFRAKKSIDFPSKPHLRYDYLLSSSGNQEPDDIDSLSTGDLNLLTSNQLREKKPAFVRIGKLRTKRSADDASNQTFSTNIREKVKRHLYKRSLLKQSSLDSRRENVYEDAPLSKIDDQIDYQTSQQDIMEEDKRRSGFVRIGRGDDDSDNYDIGAGGSLGKRRSGFVRIGRWYDKSRLTAEEALSKGSSSTGKRRTGFVRIG